MQMEEIAASLACHDNRLANLEEHRERQNGSLARLEAKMDRIYFWLIGVLGGVAASLALLIANLFVRPR